MARVLMGLTSLYIWVCSLAVGIRLGQMTFPPTIYYFFLISILTAGSLWSWRRIDFRSRPSSRETRRLIFALALAAAAWWVYRRPAFLEHSVWFDESSQFFGWNPRREVVLEAARQQQPPIDYFLARFARFFYGIGPFAVVVHAAVFATISLALFSFWLLEIGLAPWWATAPMIVFSSYFVLLQSSTEGRPIAIGVYFSLIWFFFLEERWRAGKAVSLELCVAGTLSLCSLGLQPHHFLFLMAGIFAWRELVPGFLLPMLLEGPLLYILYVKTAKTGQLVETSILSLGWDALRAGLGILFEGMIPSLGWVCFLPPILLLFTRGRRLGLKALAFSLLFPVLFVSMWSMVRWPLQVRYAVLWSLGVFLLASLCLSRFHLARATRGKAAAVGFILAAIFSLALHERFVPFQGDRFYWTRREQLDWRWLAGLPDPERSVLFVTLPLPDGQPASAAASAHYLKTRQTALSWPPAEEGDPLPAVDEVYFVFLRPQPPAGIGEVLHPERYDFFVKKAKAESDLRKQLDEMDARTRVVPSKD